MAFALFAIDHMNPRPEAVIRRKLISPFGLLGCFRTYGIEAERSATSEIDHKSDRRERTVSGGFGDAFRERRHTFAEGVSPTTNG